jgi:hypothetical protein
VVDGQRHIGGASLANRFAVAQSFSQGQKLQISSILSAICSRMPARSVGEVRAQRSFTACAASRALSMSSAEERAISQIGSPLIEL